MNQYQDYYEDEDQEEINAANAIESIMKNANTNSKGSSSSPQQSPE
jgi:hypothetical protein